MVTNMNEYPTIDINKLVPYKKNPRKNSESVAYVANSIKEFGFKVPVVIDKNNVIVTGHTRVKAAKKLGMEKVPYIRADDLNDEQIKAFRLADIKVQERSKWDDDLLEEELSDITDIDMSEFDFSIDLGLDEPELSEVDDDQEEEGYYGDERERTINTYNLDLVFALQLTDDFWEMPVIYNNGVIPDDLIELNSLNIEDNTKKYGTDAKSSGIHFYQDDYKLERLWNNPEKYVEVLKQYQCVLSPDFSLYLDMPMPMKIWNTYRSRMLGQYYQTEGINVIPTISWAEPESFKFCFSGIPQNSIVSISTIGVKRDKSALQIWKAGVDAMIKALHPSDILVYGGKIEYDYGGINVVYYKNKATERMGI